MNQTRVILIGLFCLGLTGALVLRALPESKISRSPASGKPAIEKGQQNASHVEPVQTLTKQADSAQSGNETKAEDSSGLRTGASDFAYRQELGDYAFLKQKALLSEEEKSEKHKLLKNELFLIALGELLRKNSSDNFEDQQQQNYALDILFDALREGDSRVASEVLLSVVEDGRVEDPALSLNTRKHLAGIKAEVLYQWSAVEPDRTREIEKSLPGPVSQKIWKNVMAAQQSNLAESAREARN